MAGTFLIPHIIKAKYSQLFVTPCYPVGFSITSTVIVVFTLSLVFNHWTPGEQAAADG
jgi:hypothetical protein